MARPFFFFGKRGLTVLGNHIGVQVDYAPKGGIRRAGPIWTKITVIAFLAFMGLLGWVESHGAILATMPVSVEVKGVDTPATLYITDETNNSYCTQTGGKVAFSRTNAGQAGWSCWKFYNGMVKNYYYSWATLFDYHSFSLFGGNGSFAPPKAQQNWNGDKLADPVAEAARQSMLRLCAIKKQRTAACDDL